MSASARQLFPAAVLCLKVSVADVTSDVLWEAGCPPLASAWGPADPRAPSAAPARWGFLLSPAGLDDKPFMWHGAEWSSLQKKKRKILNI